MDKLSAYILSKNSECYLHDILERLNQVADEIIILDSGSTDRTKEITRQFHRCSFHYRPFDNFKNQRNYAIQLCTHDHVLFVDSDEIPDQKLIDSVLSVKSKGFEHDAYEMNREWMVLGKKVHCMYPVKTPDSPIRLLNKKYVSFENSSLLHESPSGYRSIRKFEGNLWHNTFRTKQELYAKLDFYTDIAAQDIIQKGKRISWWDIRLLPLLIFVKWFFVKGGYKDGLVGYELARFAYLNVHLKFNKARLKLD